MDDELWASFDGPPRSLTPVTSVAPSSTSNEEPMPVDGSTTQTREMLAERMDIASQTETWDTPTPERCEKGCQTEYIPSPRSMMQEIACQIDVLQEMGPETQELLLEHTDTASQTEQSHADSQDDIVNTQAQEVVSRLSPTHSTQHASTQPSIGHTMNASPLEVTVNAALQVIVTQTATQLAHQLGRPSIDMLEVVLAACRSVGLTAPRVPGLLDGQTSRGATTTPDATTIPSPVPLIPAIATVKLPTPGVTPTTASTVFGAPIHPKDYRTPPPPCMSADRPAKLGKIKSEIVAGLNWGLNNATGQNITLHWEQHERLVEFKYGWQINGWPSQVKKQHPSKMGDGGADSLRDLWDRLKSGTCYWDRVPDARMAELTARYSS
ncbi:hypothetical protein B0H11DRAFT_1917522 [Mycena galericulata]|nr:hypothetical protein B0H11DRAFT_1917522 [Mycena galericulata]